MSKNLYSNSAEFFKILNRHAFAPSLKKIEDDFFISFSKGYVILQYDPVEEADTDKLFETIGSSKIIEVKKTKEDLPVNDNKKEFFIHIRVDPQSNQVIESIIKDKEELEAEFLLNTFKQDQQTVLPLVKLEKEESTGNFFIKDWILKENILWEKKLVSAELKVEYVKDGTFLVSYGQFAGQNINGNEEDFYISAEANQIIGISASYTTTSSSSFPSINFTEVEMIVVDTSNIPQNVDFIEGQSSQGFKFQPIAIINSDGKTVSQVIYGPFEITTERVRVEDGEDPVYFRNLLIEGNI